MVSQVMPSRIDTTRRLGQWNLESIDRQPRVKKIFTRVRGTRFPVKLLRYWFMHQLIVAESARLGRPLRICEIGVDRGQMIQFAQDAGFSGVAHWDAIDVKPDPELATLGYDKIIEANVEDANFNLTGSYDVVITLHLLEHLRHPEVLVGKLTETLEPGGILIGGYPVTPEILVPLWEKRLRANATPFRHVSAFSPTRTVAMALSHGLTVDFLSGAFFMRHTGSPLENYPLWLRLNLAFGSAFPAVGGELYWSMRKAERQISTAEMQADSVPPIRPLQTRSLAFHPPAAIAGFHEQQ